MHGGPYKKGLLENYYDYVHLSDVFPNHFIKTQITIGGRI